MCTRFCLAADFCVAVRTRLCTYDRHTSAESFLALSSFRALASGLRISLPFASFIRGTLCIISILADRLVRFLQRSLHVPPEANFADDRHEPLSAEDCAEHLLWVDETTLWLCLL